MEEEEDDDIYAPDDVIETPGQAAPASGRIKQKGDDLEEGEEGEEVEEEVNSDSVYSDQRTCFESANIYSAGNRYHHRLERGS